MKLVNVQGRLHLVRGEEIIDLASASQGVLPADPLALYERWDAVLDWAASTAAEEAEGRPIPSVGIEAPSPTARQVFAIGLNYAPHAKESGFQVPDFPFVFTKTFASISGPYGELPLPSDTIDWEVEIVAVISRRADHVSVETAWDHVAGLTVGQDFSDREVQNRLGPNSQPTLAKSRPGFSPTGPFLITPDEFEDRNDIALWTAINGVDVQRSTSAELVFSVAELVAYLSGIVPLLPGDLIFTGTPDGVGLGRKPPVYLRDGDVVETGADRMGVMRHQAARVP